MKLQSLERLAEKNLRDIVAVAEKVYNKIEIEEQKEYRKGRKRPDRQDEREGRQERHISKILE